MALGSISNGIIITPREATLCGIQNSEAELIDAKKDVVENDYDGHIAQYRILNGMGEMVHSLDLKLPEECLVDDEQEIVDENDIPVTGTSENTSS